MSVFTPEQVAFMREHRVFEGRLWEIQFASETVRCWNGNVDRAFGDGQIYRGYRGLVEAPNVAFPRDGANTQTQFAIRGMPERIEDLVWDQEAEVYGRHLIERVQILAGEAAGNHRALQPVGPAATSVIYVMRGMQSREVAGTEQGGSPTYDLLLMVELLTASRSEASFGRYSPSDQRARYPSIEDNIFADVPLIAAGQQVKLF
jgi:hypothetical protein